MVLLIPVDKCEISTIRETFGSEERRLNKPQIQPWSQALEVSESLRGAGLLDQDLLHIQEGSMMPCLWICTSATHCIHLSHSPGISLQRQHRPQHVPGIHPEWLPQSAEAGNMGSVGGDTDSGAEPLHRQQVKLTPAESPGRGGASGCFQH